MELASERTAEHPAYGAGMGKTGMPGKNNEAESTSGASGKSENGSAPVTDDTITLDSVETRMGKEDDGASPCQ